MKYLKLLFFIIFLFFPRTGYNQKSKIAMSSLALKGDNFYGRNLFIEAIAWYKKSIEKNKNDVRSFIMMAQCYRLLNEPENAITQFESVIKINPKEAEYRFQYAMALKSAGKYPYAIEQLKKCASLKPEDNRTKGEIQMCEKIINIPANYAVGYEVTESKIFNTPGREFAPVFYENGIVFSSLREDSKQKFNLLWGEVSSVMLDLYFIQTNGLIEGTGVPSAFSELNTGNHEGPASFTRDYKRIYFTRPSDKVDKQKNISINALNIYYAVKNEKGWSKPQNNLAFNSVTYNCAHPAISSDGNLLIFISDAPNGYGATDLYLIRKENDKWGTAENLGNEINTYGYELYPFLHSDGTLYFSSTGHPGIGNLDIFSASYDTLTGKFQKVQNMFLPVNSRWDDFGFTLEQAGHFGFFSSNRENGSGNDDIYMVRKKEPMEVRLNSNLLLFNTLSLSTGIKVLLKQKNAGQGEELPLINNYPAIRLQTSRKYEFTFLKERNPTGDLTLTPEIDTLTGHISVKISTTGPSLRFHGNLMKGVNPLDRANEKKDTTTLSKNGSLALSGIKVVLFQNDKKLIETRSGKKGDYEFILNVNKEYAIKTFTEEASVENIKNLGKLEIQNYTTYLKPEKPGAVILAGMVKVEDKPLENAKVDLIKNDSVMQSQMTKKDGKFAFEVEEKEELTAIVGKEGYFKTEFPLPKMTEYPPLNIPGLPRERVVPVEFKLPVKPIEMNKVVVIENILYDYKRAFVRKDAKPELIKVAKMLKLNPNLKIELRSHTDDRGGLSYNLKLSQRRADSAKIFLVDQGISPERIIPKGYGKSFPVAPHADSEEEFQMNRRTEFKVIDILEVPQTSFYDKQLKRILSTAEKGGKQETKKYYPLTPKTQGIIYRIELGAFNEPVEFGFFKGLEGVTQRLDEQGQYIYSCGEFRDKSEAGKRAQEVITAGFKDAVIATYINK